MPAANRAIQQADNARKETELKSLQQLGQMRATIYRLWSKAVQSVPAEQIRFALNVAVDTLLHNANLYKKKQSDYCLLCGEKQL